MSDPTSLEDPRRHEHRTPDEEGGPYERWYGWTSPIGLGVGVLCVGGFFVLTALGLAVLASIG